MRPHRLALPVAALLAVSACGSGAPEAGTGVGGPTSTGSPTTEAAVERLEVLTSFYPLQYAVERVGGDRVEVSSLTPPGVEPHDLELSPRQLRSLSTADAVVYLAGFQSAVDDAVAARAPEHVLDVHDAARLMETGATRDAHAEDDGHGHDEDEARADEEPHADEDGHDHSGEDPHFWLDPTRLAAVGTAIATVLSEADPDHAETYAAGAAALEADLMALDQELSSGLASCERSVVVTGHAAFGYLADRYGFTEVGIAGIDPDTEPSPARLREIGEEVREHGVTTVYTDSAAAPAVAETLAGDLGLEVRVLDPVETQVDESADYGDVMRANLAALRAGLGCS